MSDDQLISDEIRREGGEVLTNDPADAGGETFAGLSSKANPDLFAGGHIPTDAQVRQRYEERYIVGPGFDKLTDPKLQSLMVDWGVTSGPSIAIQAIQRVVGVPADGVFGEHTLEAIDEYAAADLVKWVTAERIMMIGRLVAKNPSQAKFVSGWLNRACEWLEK